MSKEPYLEDTALASEPFVPVSQRTEPHFHKDENGLLVRCYHESKSLVTNWRFWAGMTFGFPFEHFLYEKVWPFTLVTHWMGL